MRAREAAVLTLDKTRENYANLLLKDILKKVEPKDRALASMLVYGVLSNRTRLDYTISHFCDFDKPSETVKNILRVGVFQLLFTDRIPASAAVNESVSLAKRFSPHSAGFVNGVLRRASAEKVELPDRNDLVKYLKIKYSFPKSIIKKWISMFGEEEAEKLLCAMNEPAPMYLRVNRLKASAEDIISEIGGEAVLPNLIKLKSGMDIEASELYKNGFFTVMQKSSVLVCNESGVKPGMRVLDMCAAPGGKTLYLAELMENKGEITACDLYPHRTELIQKNAGRMGIDIVNCIARDSLELNEEFIGAFDFVLLDAPCSGYGVIQQKPDIKWRKREGGLPDIQKRLAGNAVRYLKEDGKMIYSTCTLNDEENENIAEYIKELGMNLEFMKTYLPHIDGTNGFFAAKFSRR